VTPLFWELQDILVTSLFIKTFLGVTWLIGEYVNVSIKVSVLFYRERFTNDENRDGSRNVSILAVQPPDGAASLRKFTEFSRRKRFRLWTYLRLIAANYKSLQTVSVLADINPLAPEFPFKF